jgi:hypothetical protein
MLLLASPAAAQLSESDQNKAQAVRLLGNRDFAQLNALAAQLGYAVLTAKALQHDPDLVLGRVMLAGGTLDILQNPLSGLLRAWGLRSHRQSFLKAMRPNSSLS